MQTKLDLLENFVNQSYDILQKGKS